MKLTPKEAAERARVSAGLVYQWCAERRLPHLRLGRRGTRGKIVIDEGDLDAFLAALKVGAGGAPAPAPARVSPEYRHLKL